MDVEQQPFLKHIIFYSDLTASENDNVDFSVVLSDGRTFTFTASTPTNIVEAMQSAEYSDLPAWIEEGMVLVRRIDETCIRYAVERCIALGIEKYGVLAVDPYD